MQGLHEDLAALVSQRDKNKPLPPPNLTTRILIVKLDRVGDMVNTTPVFDFLRSRYPDASIDILGHPAVLTLLDDDPRLSGRFAYKSTLYHAGALRPPGFATWTLIRELRRKQYQLIIYLRGSFPLLFLARHSQFISCKFLEGEPVIRRYLKPLGALKEPDGPLPLPSLHVSEASRKRVLEKYPHFASTPNIIIHAVSAAEGKQWPLARFARIADALSIRTTSHILFLAAPSEIDKLEEIRSLCERSHLFETTFRLPDVVAAISMADVFIGNDSGLAHIAAAVGTREVLLWGGANLEMARPVTIANHCTILYRNVPCRTICPEVRCVSRDYLKCLTDIPETEVVTKALEYLSDACVARSRAAK
jgi:heptosyltransferase-2/heptosyltransferase-3